MANTHASGSARLVQVICGIASIPVGLIAGVLGVVPWLDMASLGLDPIKPTGIGFYYQGLQIGVGLGWLTLVAGVVMIVGGLVSLIGSRVGSALSGGAGAATLAVALAAMLFRGHLVLSVEQVGIPSELTDTLALTPALPLLVVMGTAAIVLGIVGTCATGVNSRVVTLLVAAVVVGLVVAGIAIAVVWWQLSQGVVRVSG